MKLFIFHRYPAVFSLPGFLFALALVVSVSVCLFYFYLTRNSHVGFEITEAQHAENLSKIHTILATTKKTMFPPENFSDEKQAEVLPFNVNNTFDPETTSALAGTDVDGELLVDSAGHFVATQAALLLFDYYFMAKGEVSDEQIVSTLYAKIYSALEQPALSEAVSFFQRYLQYRQQAETLMNSAENSADMESRYELIASLRIDIFGKELSEQLFADEERQEGDRMDRYLLLQDENMTDSDKKTRRDELLAALPEKEKKFWLSHQAPFELAQKVSRLREQGASDVEVWQLREEAYGYEAARRLAVLDKERAVIDSSVTQP